MKIPIKNLSNFKMVANPPQEIIDAGYKVIHNGKVKQWVGIGWVEEDTATEEDYKLIPEVE
jgi:hypothetical protein